MKFLEAVIQLLCVSLYSQVQKVAKTGKKKCAVCKGAGPDIPTYDAWFTNTRTSETGVPNGVLIQ